MPKTKPSRKSKLKKLDKFFSDINSNPFLLYMPTTDPDYKITNASTVTPPSPKPIKAYAIVWKEKYIISTSKFFVKNRKVNDGIVSIHLEKPVVSQDALWEIKNCEIILK